MTASAATAAADTLIGGAGRDRMLSRGGGTDSVNCGRGRDVAIVDEDDTVSSNCEIVRVG